MTASELDTLEHSLPHILTHDRQCMHWNPATASFCSCPLKQAKPLLAAAIRELRGPRLIDGAIEVRMAWEEAVELFGR